MSRFLTRGFKLVALKTLKPSIELAQQHYQEHTGKPFFERITKFISSSVVVAMVLEGDNVIDTSRKMIGATNAANAELGTIRGDYALVGGKNCIHGSDSVESAKREISLWFADSEVYDPVDHHESWIYEKVTVVAKPAVVETVQIDTCSAPKL